MITWKKRTDPADDRCINGFLCYFHSVHAGYEYGLSVIGIPFPLTCKRPALEVTENQKQMVDGMLKEIISKIQK